jgi:hypothetical protein
MAARTAAMRFIQRNSYIILSGAAIIYVQKSKNIAILGNLEAVTCIAQKLPWLRLNWGHTLNYLACRLYSSNRQALSSRCNPILQSSRNGTGTFARKARCFPIPTLTHHLEIESSSMYAVLLPLAPYPSTWKFVISLPRPHPIAYAENTVR